MSPIRHLRSGARWANLRSARIEHYLSSTIMLYFADTLPISDVNQKASVIGAWPYWAILALILLHCKAG